MHHLDRIAHRELAQQRSQQYARVPMTRAQPATHTRDESLGLLMLTIVIITILTVDLFTQGGYLA